MKSQPLTRSELEQFHSLLRRAAERAERNKDARLAEKLAEEVRVLAVQLAVEA